MLEKTLGCQMEFSSMEKGHTVIIILLYLMELNMKPSMLTQVFVQECELRGMPRMKFLLFNFL